MNRNKEGEMESLRGRCLRRYSNQRRSHRDGVEQAEWDGKRDILSFRFAQMSQTA